ncbi:IS5 family transposase [Cohaesibacter intestini]|uniref:IS5 family transposase n=1 Tax=Cohaesibacter intestini TaxID=2211145 RepID=UPI000DE9DEA1|nr:IS5 family transposase [Cohaesibacter intestini]
MGIKNFNQLGFAEQFVRQRKTRKHSSLEQVDATVDWDPIMQILSVTRAKVGRKGYPPLLMFKALLLAQWHDLSDVELEYRVSDSLSFRKFVGLPLDHVAPDETSFVNFRKALRQHQLEKKLFDEITRQLDASGLILRKGTIMDATLVSAAVSRPSVEAGEVSEADPDAEFSKKNGKSYFGYKLHIGLDQGSGLIRKLLASGASLHDGQASEDLISWDEEQVSADKAYESAALRAKLRAQTIKDRIMRKKPKGKSAPIWQVWWNKTISSFRFEVEQVFGIGKECSGLERTRYRGLRQVKTQFYLFGSAYNLKRAFG